MKLRSSDILTLLLLTALSALMLQSCTYHDKVIIDERPSAIVMGVSSVATKGVVEGNSGTARLENLVGQCFDGSDNLKENAGFGVYGYKKVVDKSSILFDNTQVYPLEKNPATAWTYYPIRFWDLTASYQFIAYWPLLPDVTQADAPYVIVPEPDNPKDVTEDEKVLTIYNIPNWQRANTGDDPIDYMTATSIGSYQANYAYDNGVVHMTFGHLLSQLILVGYYIGIEENKVTIKSIKLNGVRIPVPNGKSTYTQSFDEQVDPSFDITKADNVEHMLYAPQSPATGMVLPEDTYYDIVTGKNKDYGDDPITQPITRWLVVPSTGWGNITLDVLYSIEGVATFKSTVTGISFTSNDGTNERPGEMLSGKTYILTLRFDSSGGGIDVKTVWVNQWQQAPNPINHEVYNW